MEKETKQNYSFIYSLSNETDYTMYVHEPGEEFWLLLGIYPYDITSVKIDAHNR